MKGLLWVLTLFALAVGISRVAVAYTHLDVYKRQKLVILRSNGGR